MISLILVIAYNRRARPRLRPAPNCNEADDGSLYLAQSITRGPTTLQRPCVRPKPTSVVRESADLTRAKVAPSLLWRLSRSDDSKPSVNFPYTEASVRRASAGPGPDLAPQSGKTDGGPQLPGQRALAT